MEFKVNLPGEEQLTEMIVNAVVAQILHGDAYNDGIRIKAEEAAIKAMKARIDAEASAIVESCLSAPIQPTNTMGEPIGDPVTLRQRIANQIEAFMVAPVDNGGRARGEDRYDPYGGTKPRMQRAVETAVNDVATRELAQATAAAASAVRTQLNGKVTEAVSDTIKKLLKL